MESAHGVPRVIRTGEAELYSDMPDWLLFESAGDQEQLKAMRKVEMKSAMIVPMVARDRTLGAVSFLSAESGRHYGPEDLELAKHLGRRAALAIDNARLYREAQEAISVRNELFSIISHDLKNPLTGIKGMAQLLKRQIARMEIPSKDRVIECLSSIDNTATRMTEQIDELLDLARLQMGRAGLADLIERCCRHASRFAEGLSASGYSVLNEVVLNQVLVSFGDAEKTRRVIAGIQADGTCWCGGTMWQEHTAMRISVSSWATTEEDVERSLEAMIRIARKSA
jgi:signal transduction histidine kinase